MTYEQSMQFLSGLPNYEQQSPAARDLTLEPVRTLLHRLGNPHHRLFVVHVAGSKGKGSVAAMLEAIVRHAGYRTGLYTSPQLTCIEERITVNANTIPCRGHDPDPHVAGDSPEPAGRTPGGERDPGCRGGGTVAGGRVVDQRRGCCRGAGGGSMAGAN